MTSQVDFLPTVLRDRLTTPSSRLESFCQQWNIQELALFGSVIRDDFNSASDIDVLIDLNPSTSIGLFDIVRMKAELSQLFGRSVDITQKKLLKNPFSKAEILRTYRTIYPSENANFTSLIPVGTLMTEKVRDNASLYDMVKAMQAIERFVLSKTFEDYLSDELLRSAVERKLEILGEAANRVSASFQSQHPAIDWSNIVGFRNVIIHQYDELDYENVWKIVTHDVPLLLAKIQPLVPDLPKAEIKSETKGSDLTDD